MTQSLITTPFGATSTADEVIAGVDLTGKRAIVTGSSSGIGRETARALAGAGAEVTLAVRNAGAGQEVAEDIIAATRWASAICGIAGPVAPTGKKRSGSLVRHAASSRQFLALIMARFSGAATRGRISHLTSPVTD